MKDVEGCWGVVTWDVEGMSVLLRVGLLSYFRIYKRYRDVRDSSRRPPVNERSFLYSLISNDRFLGNTLVSLIVPQIN